MAMVRIDTLSAMRSGEINPTAPQYGPRAQGSSSSITCMARTFGAPVTEPGGNVARRISVAVMPGCRRAEISATQWCTVAWLSSARDASTRTPPATAMRPRSLRIRSTIMWSSAASLALAISSAGSSWKARVPLIGRVTAVPARRSTSRNSSGLMPTSAWVGVSRYAP